MKLLISCFRWSFAFEGEMIKVTTNRTDLAEEVQTYIIVARFLLTFIILKCT